MMTFRKLAAASAGKLIRAYFTENTPQPIHDFRTDPDKQLDSGERLTSYYTGRDSRATWRPDMAASVAAALGVDHKTTPKDADLDQLFEAKRGDTGEAWSKHERKISAFDLTLAPHKSVTLAAEFVATAAETAMIWHAIDRANDMTMRYVAREVGWARKGKGGEDGADPGAVGWVSFRHHTARPTLPVQDGQHGATYLAQSPVSGDPHAHIHNALFNMVVTDDGRIGSLDTKELTATRVHIFGAYFQARLADELRLVGAQIKYDKNEQAVVLEAIPDEAVQVFSKGHHQVLGSAKAYAQSQGLEWDNISAEGKFKILSASGLASRLKKTGDKNDREIWREQAEAIGWQHKTIIGEAKHEAIPDEERFDRAYAFAAKHLAKEFHTAAVIDHDKLRLYATRGLIGSGIDGGIDDIDKVVELIEQRGLKLRGEQVALITGLADDKIRVTNSAQIRIEENLAAQVRRAAADRSGALSNQAIRSAITASGFEAMADDKHGQAQVAAIYALGQGGGFSLLTGVAGAGKTTLMKPLVAAWRADTRFDAAGREVVGIATGWRQSDALKEAGVTRTMAIAPLLLSIDKGEFSPSRNTVLVIDEISQVAPRALLALLELQQRTGLTIKALGDREQAQSVEAGDAIEIMHRVMRKEDMPELISSVRQVGSDSRETLRLREIASLFRGVEPELEDDPGDRKKHTRKIRSPRGGDADADQNARTEQERHSTEVQKALEMKRADGTASFIGGDHDQVLGRIADFYLERRDHLRAAGSTRGVTVSALTNADAADISNAVRSRMKARGELGDDERIYDAIDQRGEQYAMPIATGDKIRLFRRTWAKIDGKGGSIGNNGDIVEVVGRMANGLILRDKDGRVGEVEWRRLEHKETGRLMIGLGHAMTIDAAQGITSGEHINALPRGSAGMTGFTAYVAESRARGKTWTMISEAATFEAVRSKRALGDLTLINSEDLWDKVASDMAAKPYKALGMDLLQAVRANRDQAIRSFMQAGHAVESAELDGRKIGREVRDRLQAEAVRGSLPALLASLDKAIVASETGLITPMSEQQAHLRGLRVDTELARRQLDGVAIRQPSSPSMGA